ncbi:hypothetical protein K466DRAFT_591367 [Polyporus arcularius HHB13444]|uniref:DUF6699 domain-containing protein n=1 Tax=Polyporus arcularius HHB13444 TaxID=1314778 RepID=A0A5C3NV83_9APHY|nr:hypothetical protein K466DRAFT_591367 [Polyporus arcularius HHB13444]
MESKKKVRFADIPRTPSPSSSSTSFGSSPGPSTPPQPYLIQFSPTVARPAEYPPWQLNTPRPSTTRMPSPPCVPAVVNVEPDSRPSIDPLLSVPHHHLHPPPLRWDVAEHPNNITLGSVGSPRARELSPEDLASCAVRRSANGSPMMLRRITLVFPGLPLMVEIEPADGPVLTPTPRLYLTVGDVLYGLYKALRLSVPPREFDALNRAHRESVRRAFEKRLASDRENYEKNVHHGVRRIDYLGEMRQFVGLRPATVLETPAGQGRGEVFSVVLAPAH